MPQQHNKRMMLALILLYFPIIGASIDIYVPSFPALTHVFATSENMVQRSLSMFLFGSLLQLLFGPVSDAIGRKPFIWGGLSLFTLTSYLITQTSSIELFLLYRFIQGVALSSATIGIRAIMPDVFDKEEIYKYSSYLSAAWTLGPIMAPFLGGYFQQYYSWQWSFYFLGSYSLVILLLFLFAYRETNHERRPFSVKQSLTSYREILAQKYFLGGLICLSIISSKFLIFEMIAPFLIQVQLKHSAMEFGIIALIMASAETIGNLTNRILISYRLNIDNLILRCYLICIFVAGGMLILAYQQPMTLPTLLLPVFAMIYFTGIVFPNIYAELLSQMPNIGATTGGLIGAFLLGANSFTTMAASVVKPVSHRPLAWMFLVLWTVSLLIYRWAHQEPSEQSAIIK